MSHELARLFRETFGADGEMFVASAPGRVNLIGEHTDYNGGYVMPMALDRRVSICCRARADARVVLWSAHFKERAEFNLSFLRKVKSPFWLNYPQGVAAALLDARYEPRGFDGVIASDAPIGAGLSSSAALEAATAMAFCAVSGLRIERVDLARLCQRAENEFVGMRCGIMDPFIALHGEAGKALFLDCLTLEHSLVPLDNRRARIILCDTGVKRELAASAYNERRATCESALARIGREYPRVKSYHDLTPEIFAEARDLLSGKELMRARHVVSENARVLESARALRAGDLEEFGRLMNASHESLRDDFEVSCAELDLMIESARQVAGTLGARLTGAGFGGCTVNLARNEAVAEFLLAVPRRYRELAGIEPRLYEVSPGAGATVERCE